MTENRMRSLLLAAIFLAMCGCGSKPPLTARGKPVAFWVESLTAPSPKVRKRAVAVLGHVGDADPAAIPALISALKDPDGGVREQAVIALLNLGAQARNAVPALEQALHDREARVRTVAARALERVRGG
jgi:HEAT repeat protein